MVIAIDGTSGAGKSTVARALAQRFHLNYLDTGAMYRALALKAARAGATSPSQLAELAATMNLAFLQDVDGQRVILDNEDVTEVIRAPEIGNSASAISVHPEVRRQLVELQQALISEGDWTLEGRDTTTVVAPKAELKIYLDAAPDIRAQRRTEELQFRGMPADFDQVLKEIIERDHRDMNREDSPLRRAPDAVEVRTDEMTADQVVDHIARMIHE